MAIPRLKFLRRLNRVRYHIDASYSSRVFPWRWQVPTATAADFGVQILPDVQPVQLQNESWLLIWEVVTVTVIVFGAPACSCCEVGFPARRERCVGLWLSVMLLAVSVVSLVENELLSPPTSCRSPF